MISHVVRNDKFRALSEKWSNFLKPYDSEQINISILYDDPCPIFIDSEQRKFQIDFENDRTHYHKRKSGIGSEPLSRALGSGKYGKRVLDISAGMGVDAVFLAQLGYEVTAIERNPFIYCALENAWKNANFQEQLQFVFSEALAYLNSSEQSFDVCYFDPMFPTKTKSALPKQEMLFFKSLVGADNDAESVLAAALNSKRFKRCVVKRPLSADAFEFKNIKPAGHIKGKIIRYDIYSN